MSNLWLYTHSMKIENSMQINLYYSPSYDEEEPDNMCVKLKNVTILEYIIKLLNILDELELTLNCSCQSQIFIFREIPTSLEN